MKDPFNTRNWHILVLLMVVFCPFPVWADGLKTVHIKNPYGAATDMHVTFYNTVLEVKPVNGPGTKSDHFSAVTGINDTSTANFGGGTLGSGATDNFDVKIKGNPNKNEFFVQLVDFTVLNNQGQSVSIGKLDPNGNPAQKKLFQNNVKGFTNNEVFDFSDPMNAELTLFGEPADSAISVSLSDFMVFKNLPLSNFNLDNYKETSGGTAVFSAPMLTIGPGSIVNIPLGPVGLDTYSLATVGAITVTDLVTADTVVFSTPQSYAQDFVPEPPTILLLAMATLCIPSIYAWQRWRRRTKSV
jgi:hypothetical protein